jgi:hypothetical protein
MRSFENVVRDGRFRVPKTGTPLVIGSPVELDSAAPGFLKQAGAAAVPGPNCGIVIFEHIQNKSDALTTIYDAPYTTVPLGQYAQMMHGPGAKVWFKTVADKVLYDGRTQATVNLLDAAVSTFAIGDGLVPSADGQWAKGNGTTDVNWLIVEQVNSTTGLVEARFTF